MRNGFSAAKQRIAARLTVPASSSYSDWVGVYDSLSTTDIDQIKSHIERFDYNPVISIVMPTYNSKIEYLRRAIDTVLAQVYPHWELCIADDASKTAQVRQMLTEYAKKDSRIKVVFREVNGHISAASNSALELVTGDFVALLDHDDELPRHALYMVAAELNRFPDTDLVYSDEDKIDEAGKRYDPHFKSDWNAELFYHQNMINHLGVYRASLLREIGGFRLGFEGSQDYDLALRAILCTSGNRIRHIPHVLYHWRVFATSGSFSTDHLDHAAEAGRRAVAEHFQQLGEDVEILAGHSSYNRVKRKVPDPAPMVSLIIPTRDRVDLLRGCVDGLLHRTNYPNLEILILDNASSEPETLQYFSALQDESRVRILPYPGQFNFSAINNFGVAQARGSIIGFINNDIEVIEPDWLSEMVAHAVRPNVGAVGAKLLYADNSIQHAGVILGIGGIAGHSHKMFDRSSHGYFSRLQLPQHLSAVTAACLVMRRTCFEEIGGYDAENLAVAFNDVDLCLKVRAAGYDIIWTPYAELYHLESASRGSDVAPREGGAFRARSSAHAGAMGGRADLRSILQPSTVTLRRGFLDRLAFKKRETVAGRTFLKGN
jgi:glycosyltransferase involved in cell wall biosynthesis